MIRVDDMGMTAHERPDRVLTLDEVCAMTRDTKATLYYKRHKGDVPYLFKIGRRLVAYERDVAAYIAADGKRPVAADATQRRLRNRSPDNNHRERQSVRPAGSARRVGGARRFWRP